MTPLGANKSENFIDFTKIKPLVIDEVIVKAKKPKKKDEKKEESDEVIWSTLMLLFIDHPYLQWDAILSL